MKTLVKILPYRPPDWLVRANYNVFADIVASMTLHLWFSVFNVRNGFVMAEETQLAGNALFVF